MISNRISERDQFDLVGNIGILTVYGETICSTEYGDGTRPCGLPVRTDSDIVPRNDPLDIVADRLNSKRNKQVSM